MKTRILTLITLFIALQTIPALSQTESSSSDSSDLGWDFLSGLEDISAFSVMKTDGDRFNVSTFEGDDITDGVIALKTPNKQDLLFYDIESNVTSVCVNFYGTETEKNEWLPCNLVPESSTGLYWILSNNFSSFYIIQNGTYLDMSIFKLRASSNPNEYIVQENGVDKYVMKDLKNKNQNEFYPLELIE